MFISIAPVKRLGTGLRLSITGLVGNYDHMDLIQKVEI